MWIVLGRDPTESKAIMIINGISGEHQELTKSKAIEDVLFNLQDDQDFTGWLLTALPFTEEDQTDMELITEMDQCLQELNVPLEDRPEVIKILAQALKDAFELEEKHGN